MKGDCAAAESLVRRTLAGEERALGPGHPHTLSSVNNLALLYFDLRRYADAAPLFERAYRGYAKRSEGAFVALLTRSHLGLSLLGDGKPREAEPHLLAGYDGLSQEKALSDKNRNRLRWVTAGLAEVSEQTNRPEKAAEWRAKLAKLPPEAAPPPRPVR